MTRTVLASATKEVVIGFDQPFCVIGERINPTGRKKLAAEMVAGNFDTVRKDALEQVAAGALVLDVNAGVTAVDPNTTEPPLLVETIKIVQSLVDLPDLDQLLGAGRAEGRAGGRASAGRWSIPSPARRTGWRRSCRSSRNTTCR